MAFENDIRDIIIRLGRLEAATGWTNDLNPTQLSVLNYLTRANRFSRSPSHVADYLGTTRGTTSQSLKSLLQKGYVEEQRSEHDRRVISYKPTPKASALVGSESLLAEAAASFSPEDSERLAQVLTQLLSRVVRKNQGRKFGLCHTCMHHQCDDNGAFCGLLSVRLTREDANQICFEQETA